MADHNICSAEGRGIPDVAARGDRYRVIIGGLSGHVGGTSASAPVRHRLTHKADAFGVCN